MDRIEQYEMASSSDVDDGAEIAKEQEPERFGGEFIQPDTAIEKEPGDFEFVSVPTTKVELEPEDFDPLLFTAKEQPVKPRVIKTIILNKSMNQGPVIRQVQPTQMVQRLQLVRHGSILQLVPPTPSYQSQMVVQQQPTREFVTIPKLQKIGPIQSSQPNIREPGTSRSYFPIPMNKLKLPRPSREPDSSGRGGKVKLSTCLHCNTAQSNIDKHLDDAECFVPIIKCSNCQRIFSNEHNYSNHFSKCAFNNINCEFCDKVFVSNYLFAYHWYNEHTELIPKGIGDCKFCGSSWCQMLVGAGKPKCTICSTQYSSRGALMKHVHSSHGTADFQIKRIIKKRLTCNLCYGNFESADEISKHYLHMSCKFRKCATCSAILKDQASLAVHTKICHKDETVTLVPGEFHECTNCDAQPIPSKDYTLTIGAKRKQTP